MLGFIFVLFFIMLVFIGTTIAVSRKARKNTQNRSEESAFIPPLFIGDSTHRHDHSDSHDSSGGVGDFGGDGGGGGGGDF